MSYRKSVVVTTPHEAIFNKPPKTTQQIIDEMSAFKREAVITICSKLSLLLNSEYQERVAIQARIGRDLLNREQWENVLAYEKKHQEEDGQSPPVHLFHYVPVMMLLKLNLEHNDASGKDVQNNEDREFVASWLLSLTEKVAQEKNADKLKYRPFQYRKEALRKFFAKQFLLNAEPDPITHLVGRSEAMLKYIKLDRRLNCEQIFYDATGLTLDEYQQFLLMLLAGWKIFDEEKNLNEITARSVDRYFKHTDLSREKVEKLIDLLSFDASQYDQLQQSYSYEAGVDPDSSTNFILFIHKPLMRYGGNFMCISPNFLALKLTEGAYRVIEAQVKGDKSKHAYLAQMWGDAFEKYLHDRFGQMLGSKYHRNPPTAKGAEPMDGIGELKATVLLLEYKYAHWNYLARFTGSRVEMKKFLERLIRYKPRFDRSKGRNTPKKKGLGQIKYYLEGVLAGTFVSPVDLESRKLLPIVVSGEEYPFDPLNRMYIEGFANSQECCFKQLNVLPFLILSAEEVELLQAVVDEKGVDFVEEILTRYSRALDPAYSRTKSLPDRPASLRNELLHAGIQIPNSSFIRLQLDDFFSRVKKHFKRPTGRNRA